MAGKYRIPNFRKLYPEASDAIIAVLKKTERQMQYQEYDIKSEVVKVNQSENCHQFAADQLSVEDEVICRLLRKKLYAALRSLTEDERQIIIHIFFWGTTERELAQLMALSHTAIHKRKLRILSKLKVFLKEFEL